MYRYKNITIYLKNQKTLKKYKLQRISHKKYGEIMILNRQEIPTCIFYPCSPILQ